MIIWLASYPKSGNTLLRSMLTGYFFSKDGNYDFTLIKNIKQFPHGGLFKELGVDLSNQNETIKKYIEIQKIINRQNNIKFLKTHSYLFNFKKNYPFTDLRNTLGVIYIVRDPRNVVTSFSKYKNISIKESANFMINGKGDGFTWTNTWGENYRSWKELINYNKYLLIKYEDLIENRENVFIKILEFIHKLNNTKLKLDLNKIKNLMKTTSFEYLQKLENEKGFSEAGINQKTGKNIPFFNLGPKNNWKEILDPKITNRLEIAFKDEMVELGYLQ